MADRPETGDILLELARSVASCGGPLPAGRRGRLRPCDGWSMYDLHEEVPLEGFGVPHDVVLVVHQADGREVTTPLRVYCLSGRLRIRCRKCWVDVFDASAKASRHTTPARVEACKRQRERARAFNEALRASNLRDRARWAAAHEERLREGRGVALARERAFLGSLILMPDRIRPESLTHEEPWFIDSANVSVMDALVTLAHGKRVVSVDTVCAELEGEGALERFGGREAVEALVAPSGLLDEALAELNAHRMADGTTRTRKGEDPR